MNADGNQLQLLFSGIRLNSAVLIENEKRENEIEVEGTDIPMAYSCDKLKQKVIIRKRRQIKTRITLSYTVSAKPFYTDGSQFMPPH